MSHTFRIADESVGLLRELLAQEGHHTMARQLDFPVQSEHAAGALANVVKQLMVPGHVDWARQLAYDNLCRAT